MGFTDDETVMLDFDNTTFKDVRYWAEETMKRFKLGGFLILKSSKNNYHVVFNRRVDWSENMSIVASVTLACRNPRMTKWFLLQCRKSEPTLRVGPKGSKPSPRIVYRYGRQDDQIREFLLERRRIKRIMKKLAGGFD